MYCFGFLLFAVKSHYDQKQLTEWKGLSGFHFQIIIYSREKSWQKLKQELKQEAEGTLFTSLLIQIQL